MLDLVGGLFNFTLLTQLLMKRRIIILV